MSIQSNVPGDPPIIIQPPFTIEFDVTRDVLASLNDAYIKIYNLSPNTRNLILADYNNFKRTRKIFLQAGYGAATQLPTIFNGNIFQAYSRRSGTDFITEIEAHSGGGPANSAVYRGSPFPPDTSDRDFIVALVNSLAAESGLSPGFIGNYPNKSVRSRMPTRPIIQEINEISGNGLFIDQVSINVFNNLTESIPKPTTNISSANGLLETPSREQQRMTVPIIFTPEIVPGQLIYLQSETIETKNNFAPGFNSYSGISRVNRVHHMGIISEAICGSVITELGVVLGSSTSI